MDLYKLHPDPKKAPYREWAFDKVPSLVWEKYKNQPKEIKKREKVLAKDAKYAYRYALLLGEPFPAGEAAIAKNGYLALQYARYALQGPFPAGEAAIAKNAGHSYAYARDILELPDAEAQAWPKKLKESLLAELLALREPL